ncbi:hypothetical protein [Mycoplasma testudineum]|nr:hypothetical protein [Mycoplasma testudineum]
MSPVVLATTPILISCEHFTLSSWKDRLENSKKEFPMWIREFITKFGNENKVYNYFFEQNYEFWARNIIYIVPKDSSSIQSLKSSLLFNYVNKINASGYTKVRLEEFHNGSKPIALTLFYPFHEMLMNNFQGLIDFQNASDLIKRIDVYIQWAYDHSTF